MGYNPEWVREWVGRNLVALVLVLELRTPLEHTLVLPLVGRKVAWVLLRGLWKVRVLALVLALYILLDHTLALVLQEGCTLPDRTLVPVLVEYKVVWGPLRESWKVQRMDPWMVERIYNSAWTKELTLYQSTQVKDRLVGQTQEKRKVLQKGHLMYPWMVGRL